MSSPVPQGARPPASSRWTNSLEGGWLSNRPDVLVEAGVPTFRASALGGCLRGLVAARLGLRPQPPKAFLQEALRASSEAEGTVVDILEGKGWVITEQQKQVRLELAEGIITGHLDGMVNDRVLEIKAFGRTLFEKYVRGGVSALGKPFAQMYGMQIAAYMLAEDKPATLVVFRKETEKEGEKLGQYLEQNYDKLPYTVDVLNARMRLVNEAADAVSKGEEWPECDAGCGPSSWYWHIHADQPREIVSDEVLAEKLQKAHQLKGTIQTLTDQHDKLKQEIKDQLGVGKHVAGRFSATIGKRTRTLTDLDRLRRDMGDEFLAAYAYEQTTVSLTIREKE